MFKILYLHITNHFRFDNLEIDFVKEKDIENGPYTSLIIGPNGTGKSQILVTILEIFNVLLSAQNEKRFKPRFKYYFDIKYTLNDREYLISYTKDNFILKIDNHNQKISEFSFPTKFIASSISLNDRFPFLTPTGRINNKRYEYLGVKTTSNASYISGHMKGILTGLRTVSKKG